MSFNKVLLAVLAVGVLFSCKLRIDENSSIASSSKFATSGIKEGCWSIDDHGELIKIFLVSGWIGGKTCQEHSKNAKKGKELTAVLIRDKADIYYHNGNVIKIDLKR